MPCILQIICSYSLAFNFDRLNAANPTAKLLNANRKVLERLYSRLIKLNLKSSGGAMEACNAPVTSSMRIVSNMTAPVADESDVNGSTTG